MRSALKPRRWASRRYSSMTGFTSRGGTEWRSKTSVMGMRIGSESCSKGALLKSKSPASRSQPGPKTITAKAAHLTSSDLLRPILAQDRFHLIFQTEFQLLQSRFLQLLFVSQMGKRFQGVQFVRKLRVLAGEPAKLLVCRHQMRFQFFLCVPFHH